MARPLIGITCETNALEPDSWGLKDGLRHAYSRAVWNAGGVPVLVSNFGDEEFPAACLGRLDGLLLSGGRDLYPAYYREQILNDTVRIDSPRDRSEVAILKAALDRDMPLLTICRGTQVLNVVMGGVLYQDIPVQCPSQIRHDQCEPRSVRTHSVKIEPNSRLAGILEDRTMEVNSFHHQAIRDLAPDLQAVAWAEDGIIEAVESPRFRFLVGVQFHPEELIENSPHARQIFHAFIEAV